MWNMAVLLTVLQAFDGWTTWSILKAGGRELNPVLVKLIEVVGVVPALVVVKGVAAGLGWFIALAPVGDVRWRGTALAMVAVVYVAVAVSNWRQYRKRG